MELFSHLEYGLKCENEIHKWALLNKEAYIH